MWPAGSPERRKTDERHGGAALLDVPTEVRAVAVRPPVPSVACLAGNREGWKDGERLPTKCKPSARTGRGEMQPWQSENDEDS